MLYQGGTDRDIKPPAASDRRHLAACTLKQDNSSERSPCMEGAKPGPGPEGLRQLPLAWLGLVRSGGEWLFGRA